MENNWEIIDDNGTIYSGSENEMTDMFSDIVYGGVGAPDITWNGDIKLIQVHDIHR